MKIKTKLLIGFGLLFIVVVFFGVVSVYYIEDISEYSNITLKNNYQTLTFTRDMRSVLDENDLPLSTQAAETFNTALKKQESNITEPGEKDATAGVRTAFGILTDAASGLEKKQQAERAIRGGLTTIDGLNMKAIVKKNEYIHSTVSTATLRLGGIVFVTFLILFVFVVNFPGFILKPLHEFIEGVHEIGQKNYTVRLEFKSGDEFADLAKQFNHLAANLDHAENNNLTKILSGENQVKILIEQMPGAVIGLNEKQEVLFVNTSAKKILKIGDKMVNGHPIQSLVKDIDLLKLILASGNNKAPIKTTLDGKAAQFQIKSFEIVVPNLRSGQVGIVQFAGFPAGMIYILTEA